ncbi:ABC-three component system middle component 8 [Rosenbergiella epipactidis]|uniref:ABC-three component system middle component 8 n=1 Tax=Rosenbergiella epipactidis TaxID=1544694 RepID=UPI0030C83200
MATSAFLLKELKKNQFEKITDLRLVLMEHNKNTVSLLEPSLEFLFILGLVEYHPKNDLIEYTGS